MKILLIGVVIVLAAVLLFTPLGDPVDALLAIDFGTGQRGEFAHLKANEVLSLRSARASI